MAGTIHQFPELQTPDPVNADRIYTSAMTGMYGWTTLGMVVAGPHGLDPPPDGGEPT